ncbi:MAG: hypothetical protein PF961_18550 [Planctomycetota bacterium]|jgi:hypothetical protein|nr:hypothetical protein [Planctomycetota bacterium]
MMDPAHAAALLGELGFQQAEVNDAPPQVRFLVRPRTWRERLAVVQGFRRCVVLVDVPLVYPERVGDLFGEVSGLALASVLPRADGEMKAKTPWYGYLLQVLSMVLALGLGALAGIGIEQSDKDWCVVVLLGELAPGLDEELALFAAADSMRFGLTATPAGQGIAVHMPPVRAFGANAAVVRSCIKDIRRSLAALLAGADD